MGHPGRQARHAQQRGDVDREHGREHGGLMQRDRLAAGLYVRHRAASQSDQPAGLVLGEVSRLAAQTDYLPGAPEKLCLRLIIA